MSWVKKTIPLWDCSETKTPKLVKVFLWLKFCGSCVLLFFVFILFDVVVVVVAVAAVVSILVDILLVDLSFVP